MARNASSLLINVNDLLYLQGVEKQRVEFKRAWHGKREGGTYWQVVHTICAYANDFFNDNGGYIIIGVDEKESWEDSDAIKCTAYMVKKQYFLLFLCSCAYFIYRNVK